MNIFILAACTHTSVSGLCADSLPQTKATHATLNTILSDMFVLLGAIAFLMIVIAGMRYVFARGQAEKITQAKNMIQYSVIGLIMASLAYAIVNVVIQRAS